MVSERKESMTGTVNTDTGEEELPECDPIRCPACGSCRNSGQECQNCGFTSRARSRFVVQVNGELREIRSDYNAPRKVSNKTEIQKKWDSMYYRMRNAGKTFRQAEVLFKKDHGVWPPRNLSMMPKHSDDWSKKIADVPKSCLT
jgi:hypothetical protein